MQQTGIIRPYQASDRGAVEQIHFETGFLGNSMGKLIDNRRYFSELINHYLEREQRAIFVAEVQGTVAGYILGSLGGDTIAGTLIPALGVAKNLLRLPLMSRRDRFYWGNWAAVSLDALLGKSEELRLKNPPNSGHIHINLLPAYRGKGIGTSLLEAFIAKAQRSGTHAIFADSVITRLNPNTPFWEKNGFSVYSKARTTLWKRFLPDEEMWIVCYYKQIC